MQFRRAVRLSLAAWVTLSVGACGGGGADLSAPEAPVTPEAPDPETPGIPVDTVGAPVDTTTGPEPTDTTPTPPPEPPPAPPPPEPPTPPTPPTHVGIPFGPSVYTKGHSSLLLTPPSSLNTAFSALNTDAHASVLLAELEAARRSGDRIMLSFAGSSAYFKDDETGGFSLEKWKRRVDKFRGIDISSYIGDGTLIGHFIMDEPNHAKDWNNHPVPLADIDAMAEYSKQIWPDLPAVIRTWPDYLKGHRYRYLDATWVQYHSRLGPIGPWLEQNVRGARELGLALILGLNVLSGGGKEEGIFGIYSDKYAMNASQVRSWGGTLLDQPNVCAFFMFRYQPDYFARSDIQAAMTELSEKAAKLPNRPCRRSD
jgi:hypothetical protein